MSGSAEMRIRCGTLVLEFSGGIGDVDELKGLYTAHAASAGACEDVSARVDVEVDAERARPPRSGPVASSVDPVTRVLRIATSEWSLGVPLAGEGPVRLSLARWWVPAFDHAVRCLIQVLAPLRAGAVVLHGSAVERDGLAYAFVAHANTGKTTVARLSRDEGLTVLSEEMTYVAWAPGASVPSAFSLPVIEANDLRVPHPRAAPLSGLYHLVQDTRDSVVPIGPGRRVSTVAAVTAIAVRTPVLMQAALGVVARLVAVVEPKELRFTRSLAFWDAIDAERRAGAESRARRA